MKPSFAAKATLAAAIALSACRPAQAQYFDPGSALDFTATNSQYVQIPADPSLTPNQYTFEAWVNPRTAKCNTILSRGDGGGAATDYIFQVGYDGTTCGVMKVALFAAGTWDASTNTVPLNTWTHVAVTFDGTTKRFYINGQPSGVASHVNPSFRSTTPVYIGRQGQNCDCNFFDGAIDEVRIWNVVRSQQQIQQSMNEGLPTGEPGLVGYYQMDEGSGGTVINHGTYGSFNGSLSNSPSWVVSGAQFIPVVFSYSATDVGTNKATLVAYINPGNLPTTAWFEWGANSNYGSNSLPVSLPAANEYITISNNLTGLAGLTVYHFDVFATNSAGASYDFGDATFSTIAAPIATTLPATSVTTNAATINGTVNPQYGSTRYFFEYGLTTSYGSNTIPINLPGENFTYPVSNRLANLSLGSTYHFALVASNSEASVTGADLTFVAGLPPAAETLPASAVDNAGATFNGTVNPNSLDTTAWFQWGTTTNYGSFTAPISISATNSTTTASAVLNNLSMGIVYHFQLVATNAAGTNYGADQTFITSSLVPMNAGLPGISSDSVAIGDFDNDGHLDILLIGSTSNGPIAQVWQNTGGGFSNVNANLTGTAGGSAVWGDFDNDGRLDILLDGAWEHGTFVGLWQNTPGGFNSLNTDLPNNYRSSIALGDYDNDGLVDVLITGNGEMQFDPQTQVFRNTGSGFTDINAGLPGVVDGSVAWGDFDNDGHLDILLSGQTITNTPITEVWRNTADGFTNINAGLPGIYNSSVAWGDYDNDGLPDILIAGTTDGTNVITQVWRNTGAGFTNINAGLPGVQYGSVAWGDYDNDGRLDILLSGWDATGKPITQIWRNTGSGFTNVNAGLPGVVFSSVAWGDFNNDNRLDVVLAGQDANTNLIADVWLNQTPLPNSPPSAPSGLSATLVSTNSGSAILFSWNKSDDAQTPSSGLSYNLRVGSTPGGFDIINPESSAGGVRHLPQIGNMQQRLAATLPVTFGSNYYWSVQAVDTSFAGSAFAAEHSFKLVPALAPVAASNAIPGDVNGDGIVSQQELAAVLANLDPNAAVDQANFDLMLANYFPQSAWRYPTNVEGLGQTNISFQLANPITFTVQSSTNLVDWNYLDTATPRYIFTDTNAPNNPHQYYRLSFP